MSPLTGNFNGRGNVTVEAGHPPMPVHPPDVHLRTKRKPVRTLKGDLRSLKEKAVTAGNNWRSGRETSEKKQEEVRAEAKEILAPVQGKIAEEKKVIGEIAEPVKAIIASSRGMLDPKNGKTKPYVTSFAFSAIASWAIGPQIFTALYGWARFGIFPQDWGILNGPGRWFRDTIVMAQETGKTGSLIWAAVLGLLPMMFMFARTMTANYLATSTYRGRMATFAVKWLTRSAWLVPIVFFTGVAYPDEVTWLFGSPWVMEMWQFWVAGLFCTAFYCTLWVFDRVEKRLPLGATHILLMTPLASIVTGVLLNSPGAAW